MAHRSENLPRLSSVLAVVLAFVAWAVPWTAALSQQHIDAPPPRQSILLPEANRQPDANDLMRSRERQVRKSNFEAANAERKRQIDADSALLLKLAAALKAEMDRAAGGELSPLAIREAEEIERLARNVREKMKLTVGAG